MDDNKASDLARERVLRALKGDALDVEPVKPDPEAARMKSMLHWLSRKRAMCVAIMYVVALYGLGYQLGMFDTWHPVWFKALIAGWILGHSAAWIYASWRLAQVMLRDQTLKFSVWMKKRWWDVFMFYYP